MSRRTSLSAPARRRTRRSTSASRSRVVSKTTSIGSMIAVSIAFCAIRLRTVASQRRPFAEAGTMPKVLGNPRMKFMNLTSAS
jgi:hypothetical protein